MYPADDLQTAVSDARYVVLVLPLTEETTGLVDAAVLDRMPSESYLINVARGEIADVTALLTSLDQGGIAGAALDVFREEPLPPKSPLRDRQDVILTPHSAGLYREYPVDVGEMDVAVGCK